MGYTYIRRYVVDANDHMDLVAIVQSHIDIEGLEGGEDEFNNIVNWADTDLLEYITNEVAVGDLTDVCVEFDSWIPQGGPLMASSNADRPIAQSTIDIVFEPLRKARQQLEETMRNANDPWAEQEVVEAGEQHLRDTDPERNQE